jgi:hypothetical protein
MIQFETKILTIFLPEYADVVALDVFVGNADSGLLEKFLLELIHLVGRRPERK